MLMIIEWFADHRDAVICVAVGVLASFVVTGIRYIRRQLALSREIDDFVKKRGRRSKVPMDDFILTNHDDPQNLHTV